MRFIYYSMSEIFIESGGSLSFYIHTKICADNNETMERKGDCLIKADERSNTIY